MIHTVKLLEKLSLAAGKFPLLSCEIPHANQTVLGSRPHFPVTSIAKENLSESTSRSLNLLQWNIFTVNQKACVLDWKIG